GFRDQGGPGRRRERVEMPLEPRTLRDQLGVGRADGQPPDLGHVAPVHLAAQHAGEHLAAEAEPEDRRVAVDALLHEPRLARYERFVVVERRELGAERHDQVVRRRIDLAVVDVDPHHVDLRAVGVEPPGDVPGRRGLLVLQDQRVQRGLGHRSAPVVVGDGLPPTSGSTSCATRCTASANRETISASSSSVVVNGGANRVWSPAKPSRVGWVESVISPRSNAAWSTRPATRSSLGRNDPSRGSANETPSRYPCPRTSCTIPTSASAASSSSRSRSPRSSTWGGRKSTRLNSRTATPTAHGSGGPSQV